MIPTHGFLILGQRGEIIAWVTDFLDAKRRCDTHALADRVERASDGAKMCCAPRSKFGRFAIVRAA